MAKQIEYVQLDKNDDVVAVKDRLAFIRGRRVLIIWPEEGTTLTRKLDLVLIQREADRRAIQLALVTHDAQVIAHAKELNISTFETIRSSQRGRWKRGRKKVFMPRYHKPSHEPNPEDLKPVASRIVERNKRHSPLRYILERLLVLIILVGGIGATAYIILPSATVTITLKTEDIATVANITADTSVQAVDISNQMIPAQIIRATVETTASIPTTGVEDLDSAPSTGVVTFTNKTDTAVEIPANTTLSTSAGAPILFSTTSAITVPAGIGERTDTTIEAAQASLGEIGNVEAGMINSVVGPLGDDVTVINLAPTTGGANRSIQIVSDADMQNLLNSTRVQLQSLAYTEIQARITDNQLIIIESIRIDEERNDWTIYSHSAGDVTDELSLTLRAVVSAIVIDDRFAQQVTLAQLSSQIPAGKSLQPESVTYTRGPIISQDTLNRVTFTATSEAQVTQQFDINHLQEQLAGQKLGDAQRILASQLDFELDSPPQITLSPNGFSQMPILPIRINIQVRQSS
jgi:hypothetical protein